MRIFGLEITKAAVEPTTVPPSLVSSLSGSWWGSIKESFAGAWQQGVEIDPHHTLLSFSAVYACVTLICADISKLRIKLTEVQPAGNTTELPAPVMLDMPNSYQSRIQFLSDWMRSKLLFGNTYILKERDNRKGVVALHILNPRLVRVLVADDGSVWYGVSQDKLAGGMTESVTVPASEIIHDRAICLFHPLVGIGPIYACGISATQGNRIQANSSLFFQNQSRPSGVLTAPGTIATETADRMKVEFEKNFSGANIGRLLVLGNGLEFAPMTMPPEQAQLIEQLQWTVEDVARAFHVPLHKISSDVQVKFSNMGVMNQDYYGQTLQEHIESIELLLTLGLSLPPKQRIELDLDGLLRMDPLSVSQIAENGVKGGFMAPNEARLRFNLPPVAGGNTPYMQVQNFSLEMLAQQKPPGADPTSDDVPSQAARAVARMVVGVESVASKLNGRIERELARKPVEEQANA